jgi:hypothetical protein
MGGIVVLPVMLLGFGLFSGAMSFSKSTPGRIFVEIFRGHSRRIVNGVIESYKYPIRKLCNILTDIWVYDKHRPA